VRKPEAVEAETTAVVDGSPDGAQDGDKLAGGALDAASPETPEPPDATAEQPASPDTTAEQPEVAVAVAGTDGEERWASFAPVPEVTPSGVRAVTSSVIARIVRVLAHEWTLAALGSVLLAAGMTWPTLRHPATTIPQDIWDPTLQAWQMAWAGHALTSAPSSLWDANAFYPDRYSYAFSDTLLGYAPFGAIGTGPVAAIVRYNVVFVLIFALAFFGMYALVRQLGAGRTGAAVAGAAFAFAPWRLGQAGHLHVLSVGGIALALAMLARGHGFSLRDGFRPELARWGWVVAGWLVAAWQISLGFGIGLPFAYLLAGAIPVAAVTFFVKRTWVWQVRRPFGLTLLMANLAGGLVFAAVGALMAYPYLQVLRLHPYARRSEEILTLFSPPLKGFFIPPPESALWGASYANARATLPFAPEMAVLPGFFLCGLALAGLFVSVWRVRHRVMLALGVVVSVALAMGTNGPGQGRYGYLLLYRLLPGFEGIRTPGRLVLWTTLLLALLAAGAVSAFVTRAVELRAHRGETDGRARTGFWLRLATLVPLGLVLLEGAHLTPHPVVPLSPVAMHTIADPAIILPTGELEDMNVMLWTTDGFPKVVNGGSGFQPKQQADLRDLMQRFPDAESVARLRELKIKTVVVMRGRVAGTPYEHSVDAPIDGLGLTRTESGDVVLYKVD
jgi:hypothetical protein